jgi:hypothetical protein
MTEPDLLTGEARPYRSYPDNLSDKLSCQYVRIRCLAKLSGMVAVVPSQRRRGRILRGARRAFGSGRLTRGPVPASCAP